MQTPPPFPCLEAVRLNDPTVHGILQSGGTLDACVVALANQKRDLLKRVADLELLVPRKVRAPDGSVWIYRPPAHLIPDPG